MLCAGQTLAQPFQPAHAESWPRIFLLYSGTFSLLMLLLPFASSVPPGLQRMVENECEGQSLPDTGRGVSLPGKRGLGATVDT